MGETFFLLDVIPLKVAVSYGYTSPYVIFSATGVTDGSRVRVTGEGGRGTGSAPGLDGSNLARTGDLVVVTLNHRLGAFGFTHLASVDARFADAGNAGMLDIVAALRWVRDHAADFGGDAGNVTIFGQSGGGSKVAVCMAMPEPGRTVPGIVMRASEGPPSAPID